MTETNMQTGEAWERHREEVAVRINAQPHRWEVKVEAWEEEMAESETTFARVLKRCGEYVPQDD